MDKNIDLIINSKFIGSQKTHCKKSYIICVVGTNTYGAGPFSVRRGVEVARRADRGEARERFYPASELSGEIKLLLLLCDVFRSCSSTSLRSFRAQWWICFKEIIDLSCFT